MEFTPGAVGWPAPDRFAALLHDLHLAPTALTALPLARGVASSFPRFTPIGPVTADDLALARARSDALCATPGPPVLLHGDLHGDNLLDTGRGLVVLDPKVSLGEAEFDAVDYVLGAEDVEGRRDALLAASDLDPVRLDGWCRAMAPLVAVGAVRRGLPADHLLAYARSSPTDSSTRA